MMKISSTNRLRAMNITLCVQIGVTVAANVQLYTLKYLSLL